MLPRKAPNQKLFEDEQRALKSIQKKEETEEKHALTKNLKLSKSESNPRDEHDNSDNTRHTRSRN